MPKPKALTAADVKKRVKAITKKAYDNDDVQEQEGYLHADVLSAIAEGRCEDPRACAREAVKTLRIDRDNA